MTFTPTFINNEAADRHCSVAGCIQVIREFVQFIDQLTTCPPSAAVSPGGFCTSNSDCMLTATMSSCILNTCQCDYGYYWDGSDCTLTTFRTLRIVYIVVPIAIVLKALLLTLYCYIRRRNRSVVVVQSVNPQVGPTTYQTAGVSVPDYQAPPAYDNRRY